LQGYRGREEGKSEEARKKRRQAGMNADKRG
jgi:hypothetical protein